MNLNQLKSNECASRLPTYKQVIDKVKVAEQKLKQELQKKRCRLKFQMDNESLRYQREIRDMNEIFYQMELNIQKDNLEKMRIGRELDRQKFIENKQLQQHFASSQELRGLMSKKLLEECKLSRENQLKEKVEQQRIHDAMQKRLIQDQQRVQHQQLLEEEEAERAALQQRIWETRLDLNKQLERKNEMKQMQKTESEFELKLLQKTDETRKKIDAEIVKTKLQEKEQQKEFLQRQIEQRKKKEQLIRHFEIEDEKHAAELAKLQLEKLAADNAHAKKLQHAENSLFVDYMSKMRRNEKEGDVEKVDLKHANQLYDEMEANAEIKRLEMKEKLRAERHREYLAKINEKNSERVKEKQRQMLALQETQEQNAEYEKIMLAERTKHRRQLQQELDQQVKFKEIEKAWKIEQDLKHHKTLQEMDNATSILTEKLLRGGMDILIQENPFYRCLKDDTSNY